MLAFCSQLHLCSHPRQHVRRPSLPRDPSAHQGDVWACHGGAPWPFPPTPSPPSPPAPHMFTPPYSHPYQHTLLPGLPRDHSAHQGAAWAGQGGAPRPVPPAHSARSRPAPRAFTPPFTPAFTPSPPRFHTHTATAQRPQGWIRDMCCSMHHLPPSLTCTSHRQHPCVCTGGGAYLLPCTCHLSRGHTAPMRPTARRGASTTLAAPTAL